MATVKQLHTRSIDIDAPVKKVFGYVQDPHHFLEAFDEEWRRHMALAEVHQTPDGVGSTFRMMGRMLLLFHVEWVFTRQEYVPTSASSTTRTPVGSGPRPSSPRTVGRS
ncbi:hypothetical protein GCM10027517_32080 [Phycicoccus ginsengisoli]